MTHRTNVIRRTLTGSAWNATDLHSPENEKKYEKANALLFDSLMNCIAFEVSATIW